jgi:fluoride ion exporter CrcB/FEX
VAGNALSLKYGESELGAATLGSGTGGVVCRMRNWRRDSEQAEPDQYAQCLTRLRIAHLSPPFSIFSTIPSNLPILLLFGAAMKLSAEPPLEGEVRIRGGRITVVATALLGSVTTLASMMLSFVPPPEEENPTSAVLKVAVTTGALLLGGAAVYVIGSVRARRAALALGPVD